MPCTHRPQPLMHAIFCSFACAAALHLPSRHLRAFSTLSALTRCSDCTCRFFDPMPTSPASGLAVSAAPHLRAACIHLRSACTVPRPPASMIAPLLASGFSLRPAAFRVFGMCGGGLLRAAAASAADARARARAPAASSSCASSHSTSARSLFASLPIIMDSISNSASRQSNSTDSSLAFDHSSLPPFVLPTSGRWSTLTR
eukprot:6108521-Prymnesium_polylepis.1